jgi:hypothetical protein
LRELSRAQLKIGYPAASDVRAFIMSGNWYDNDGDQYQGDKYVGPSKYGTEVKRCRMCDRLMEMSTDHGVCDSCASAMERGVEW